MVEFKPVSSQNRDIVGHKKKKKCYIHSSLKYIKLLVVKILMIF